MVENSLLEVPGGLIEAARAMGATPMQIVLKVLLPEALPSLVNGASITLIALVVTPQWAARLVRADWGRSVTSTGMSDMTSS